MEIYTFLALPTYKWVYSDLVPFLCGFYFPQRYHAGNIYNPLFT